MDADMKQRWVKALRGRKYSQGKWRLKDVISSNKPRYCCLGVLCDISDMGDWTINDEGVYYYQTRDGRSDTIAPPPLLCKAYGLTWEVVGRLASMNDAVEASFREIASWIDANL